MAFVSIKNVLAEAGLVTPAQFDLWRAEWQATEEARRAKGEEPVPPFRFFQRKYVEDKDLSDDERRLTEERFSESLARALQWEYLDATKWAQFREQLRDSERRKLVKEVCGRISTKVAFQYGVVPTRLENGRLQVAASNPFDSAMLNAVQFDARGPVELALAPKAEIEKTQKEVYGVGAETIDEMSEADEPLELELGEGKDIDESGSDASIIKFVNQVIWEAFKDRSTDIHFEPLEDELRIRYRIDGILHEQPLPPQLKRFQAAILSRIKVMSGMNISEKRLPQDGRINVRIKGQEIDIRVSTVPTVYGESVSLRLLTRGKVQLGLESLGYSERERKTILDIIRKPHGIFLVTGPTGSGKSTSLYAFLHEINSPQKRIITIEEPVEYEMRGINQIAVRPEIGLTFAMGLRHILRQDPNVVMVGEIRDTETAEIAIRAALTGHLVFSTLHTNDAPSAFTRLIDMGIEPFLVASSVEAVMAQRLVRTVCPKCKVEQHVDAGYLQRIGFPSTPADVARMDLPLAPGEAPRFWRGAGCEDCRNLGYQGRTGIFELLILNDHVRPMILGRAAATNIAQAAIDHAGMHRLREDGWKKALRGMTTIEEVLRVTQTEEHRGLLLEPEKK